MDKVLSNGTFLIFFHAFSYNGVYKEKVQMETTGNFCRWCCSKSSYKDCPQRSCFLLSAFLRNFFLCRDWLSGNVPPTLGAALLCSSRAGSDLGLYPFIAMCGNEAIWLPLSLPSPQGGFKLGSARPQPICNKWRIRLLGYGTQL